MGRCRSRREGHLQLSENMTLWGATSEDRIVVWGDSTITMGTFVTPNALCPDLLRYENIGEANGWRGRIVRGFFWLMQIWRTA